MSIGMIGGAAIGGALDVAASGMRQQEARKQHARNKDMADYMHNKQLDMWNKTNYEAQAQHLRNAGMNIGLMYGSAGQGGQTSAVAGEGGKPTATDPLGNATAMAGMGLQAELQRAQKDNIEAQTAKTEAETEAIGGYQKDESTARTADLTQGVENKKAQEYLLQAQSRLTSIQADVADMSMEDVVKKINYETERAFHEANSAKWEENVNRETINAKINILKEEAKYQAVKTVLTKAQVGLTSAQIEEIANKIKVMHGELAVKEYDAFLRANNVSTGQATGKIIERILRTGGKEENWEYQEKYKPKTE